MIAPRGTGAQPIYAFRLNSSEVTLSKIDFFDILTTHNHCNWTTVLPGSAKTKRSPSPLCFLFYPICSLGNGTTLGKGKLRTHIVQKVQGLVNGGTKAALCSNIPVYGYTRTTYPPTSTIARRALHLPAVLPNPLVLWAAQRPIWPLNVQHQHTRGPNVIGCRMVAIAAGILVVIWYRLTKVL